LFKEKRWWGADSLSITHRIKEKLLCQKSQTEQPLACEPPILNVQLAKVARLLRSFQSLCGLFGQGMSRTIPQICLNKSQAKAAYRFFAHQHITPQKMISVHRSELEALFLSDAPRRLLQISDATESDYTGKKGAAQLGSLNHVHQKGMLLHNSLLLSDSGLPLGLLWQRFVLRREEGFGKSEARLKLPIG
jgi:hypothetical protein